MPTYIYETSRMASNIVAQEIAGFIRQYAKVSKMAILRLTTSYTPTHLYDELDRMCWEEALSFANMITLTWYPIQPDALQGYKQFMLQYLFDYMDMWPENSHILDAFLKRKEVSKSCCDYELKIR